MPFDGNGVFLRLRSWIGDATAGVKIRADFHDDEDNNFAEGIGHCIAKDGQTTITQNIPWNSKRITALQDPVDPQDAATKAYADTKMPLDGSAPLTGDLTIESDDGTNSIYGDKGGKHRWEIILGNATAESGSDVGSDFELVNYHDDGTRIGDVFFGNRATGLMTVKGDPVEPLGIVTKQYADGNVFPTEDRFTTSGSTSWTVPPNITVCEVHVYGGGGGGGTGHAGYVGGGGGGAGGYARKKYTGLVPGTVISLVVGAFGAGGPAGTITAGSTGGTSNFAGPGGTVSASGGFAANAGINPIPGVPVSGGMGSGGDANLQGGYGSSGASGTNTSGGYTGYGGLGGMCPGPEGGKGGTMSTGSGSPGIGFGAGGSGGGSGAGINSPGGNGGSGAVLVKW